MPLTTQFLGAPYTPTTDSPINPVTVQIAGAVTAVPVGAFVVIVSYDGTGCSDSQSNTYTLLLSDGHLRVYTATITTALVEGVDTVTVAGSYGLSGLYGFLNADVPIVNFASASGTVTGAWTTQMTPALSLPTTTINRQLLVLGVTRAANQSLFLSATYGGTIAGTTPGGGGNATSFTRGVPGASYEQTSALYNLIASNNGSPHGVIAPGTGVLAGTVTDWGACIIVFREECPAGYHWCNPSDACVAAPDPPCKAELNCTWDPDLCEWSCEDPPECPPGYTWSWTTCQCEVAGRTVWNLETRAGQYHAAYLDTGSIVYKRSEDSRPNFNLTVTVPGGGSDSEFSMTEESFPAGRVRAVWVRSGAAVTAYSDDDGGTWSTPVTLWGAGTHPDVIHDPGSGFTLYAAYVSGHLEGRRQGPGESTPGTAFTLALAGGGAVPVDDAGFHISPAADQSGRWLLIVRDGGAVKSYSSTDEGSTWSVAT